MEKFLIFLGQFSKIARIACVVLVGVLVVAFSIELFKRYHPSISVTLLVCGIIHGLFSYEIAYSSKLEFAHLISTFFALICADAVTIFLGASMKYGYLALALSMMATVLALIPPILYSTQLKVEAWRDYVSIGLAIIGIFCFDALENSPNYFNLYITLQMFVVVIAVLFLPEKEEKQNA